MAGRRRTRASKKPMALVVILAWFMTFISYGTADDRRHYTELHEPIIGHTENRRGGVKALAMRRLSAAERATEEASEQRMVREGYNPTRGLHRWTHVWSYNCQMANEGRLKEWGHEFKDCFALLQGTQRTYEPCKGERSIQKWNTDTHDIIEHRARKRGKHSQPEGVLVMAPRGMTGIVKQILIPSAGELEGRGLAVRFSRGLYDVCVVTVYCPLGDRDPNNHKKTEKLWNWVCQVRSQIPRRTMMVVGTDSNGHVGSVTERSIMDPYVEMLEGWGRDYVHIGDHGAETENINGKLMREFLEKTNMVAVNTKFREASGKTWYGGKGGATRVDYILVDETNIHDGDRALLSRELHRRLRTMIGLEVNDHVPICWQFRYEAWHSPQEHRSPMTTSPWSDLA